MRIGNFEVHDSLMESIQSLLPMRGIVIELEGRFYILTKDSITGIPKIYLLREEDTVYIQHHKLLGIEIQYDFIENQSQAGDLKIVKLITILPIKKQWI